MAMFLFEPKKTKQQQQPEKWENGTESSPGQWKTRRGGERQSASTSQNESMSGIDPRSTLFKRNFLARWEEEGGEEGGRRRRREEGGGGRREEEEGKEERGNELSVE